MNALLLAPANDENGNMRIVVRRFVENGTLSFLEYLF
jgi:hypothetical protein